MVETALGAGVGASPTFIELGKGSAACSAAWAGASGRGAARVGMAAGCRRSAGTSDSSRDSGEGCAGCAGRSSGTANGAANGVAWVSGFGSIAAGSGTCADLNAVTFWCAVAGFGRSACPRRVQQPGPVRGRVVGWCAFSWCAFSCCALKYCVDARRCLPCLDLFRCFRRTRHRRLAGRSGYPVGLQTVRRSAGFGRRGLCIRNSRHRQIRGEFRERGNRREIGRLHRLRHDYIQWVQQRDWQANRRAIIRFGELGLGLRPQL
jgi:hypothetical protein